MQGSGTTVAGDWLLMVPSAKAMNRGALRILVVDDFKPFRQWVCSRLRKESRFVVAGEAADGLEAVQKAQELAPDLILLDLGLPYRDGIETHRQLCRVLPSAKVLFVSECMDQDIVQLGLLDGAAGYVIKRDVSQDLLPAIDTILRGGIFVSGRLSQTLETASAKLNGS